MSLFRSLHRSFRWLTVLGSFTLLPAFTRAQYAPQAAAPLSSDEYGQYAPDEEPGFANQQPDQLHQQAQQYGDSQPNPYNAPPSTATMQAQQALNTEQLEQLVAPIALYPDSLIAQILAAATYPAQVVDADHWRQSLGGAPPEQVVAGANAQSWDPSVKSLTAVPQLLAQMDQNIRWTIALGNAYYNQPQDVMDVIQVMRQRAQAAGNLASGPQEEVTADQGYIQIAPSDPDVMYLPVYNPWAVYGAPVAPYRGFSFFGALGDFLGSGFASNAIRWGGGIAMGAFMHSPFGLISWGLDWLAHTLLYHNSGYYSHSGTLVDWGLPHGGPRAPYFHGVYNRPGYHAPYYRGYGNTLRAGGGYRGPGYGPRPGYGTRPGYGWNTAREQANLRQGYENRGFDNRGFRNPQGFAGRDPRFGSDPHFGYNNPQRSLNGYSNQQAWNRSPAQSPGQGFAQHSPSYPGNNFNRGYTGQYGQSGARPGFGGMQSYRAPSSGDGRQAFGGARPGSYGGGFSNPSGGHGFSGFSNKPERSGGSHFFGGGGFKEPKAPKAPKMDRSFGGGHFGGGGHGSHGGGGHHH